MRKPPESSITCRADRTRPFPLESPAGENASMASTKSVGGPSVSRVPYAIGDAVEAHANVVRGAVGDTAALLESHGALRFGQGTIATIVAFTLGVLGVLAVLAFHFPE